MNSRVRNLAIAGFGMVLVVLLFARSDSAPGRRLPGPPQLAAEGVPSPSGAPSPATVASPLASIPRNLHTHAVDVSWLNGFPPDATPGDVFDIWVAWNKEVVQGPNIQLLLEDVTLEKIAPPVTADGPYVAYLIVTRGEARDLLYGTKYGALSVTQPAG